MPDRFTSAFAARAARLLPPRELFLRSGGAVRIWTLGTRLQILMLLAAIALLAAWAAAMAALMAQNHAASAGQQALAQRQAAVAQAQARLDSDRGDVRALAGDLARRQDMLEEMIAGLPGDATDPAADTDTDSDADGPAPDRRGATTLSAANPGLAGTDAAAFTRIAARQFAMVARLTRFAEARSARHIAAIRTLGLDPATMLHGAHARAMGGPLERLSPTARDPRFAHLALALARMDALDRGLQGVPQADPADPDTISSGFGYRFDPFTGEGAMHAGLDFAGPLGAPIHAAARGTVAFVGQRGGYGNVVEVDHGNGLMTRYAHMSRFVAHVGDEVPEGAVLGAIGSTGRSTGPHLHFEVRVNGRAVNPRPFLEHAKSRADGA